MLVDTELAVGDVEAAITACDDMVARAEGLDVPALQARVAAVRARVLAATGDAAAAAIAAVETALDQLPPEGVPLLRATLLLDLVQLHEQAGNRAAAKVEAGRAGSALAGLDVVLQDEHIALLERFLQVLQSVPDAEPAVAPNQAEFAHLLAAMQATEPDLQPAVAT